jgi:hypothetical protein
LLNELRFDIQHSEFGNLVVPLIDSKSLVSILRKIELPFAKQEGHPELVGGYDGIPISFIECVSDYYLGVTQNE